MTKNRMNLRQLVAFFNSKNLTASANYFQGCAKDSVTLDGWIEEDFVKRHVGYGQTWKEVQANVTTIMQEEFKFTFETQDDQLAAEFTGYIDSYDCVRMEVKDPQGGSIDFPVKNRESYYRLLTIHGNNIVNVYPTVHSYDIQDYQ